MERKTKTGGFNRSKQLQLHLTITTIFTIFSNFYLSFHFVLSIVAPFRCLSPLFLCYFAKLRRPNRHLARATLASRSIRGSHRSMMMSASQKTMTQVTTAIPMTLLCLRKPARPHAVETNVIFSFFLSYFLFWRHSLGPYHYNYDWVASSVVLHVLNCAWLMFK